MEREKESVSDFVRDYEFRGETDYRPTDQERELIEDAIHGYLAEISAGKESVVAAADPYSARTVKTERELALALAHRVLDRPNADPDDDLAVLSRQLLRAGEEIVRLTSAHTHQLRPVDDDDMQRASIDHAIATVDLGLSDDEAATTRHILSRFVQHRVHGTPSPSRGHDASARAIAKATGAKADPTGEG